jgi:hypothetical protein
MDDLLRKVHVGLKVEKRWKVAQKRQKKKDEEHRTFIGFEPARVNLR